MTGFLTFAAPWMLWALALVPALWWLIKVTPPAPRRIDFPAIRLLMGLQSAEEASEHIPPLVAFLRLSAVSLLILALARPLINPGEDFSDQGGLLLVVDDGWAAARDWDERIKALDQLIDRAERQNLPVSLLTTAPDGTGKAPKLQPPMDGGQARRKIKSLTPKPWPVDHTAILDTLKLESAGLSAPGPINTVWLANGLDGPGVHDLAEHLQRLGNLKVVTPAPGHGQIILLPPQPGAREMTATLLRRQDDRRNAFFLRAYDQENRLLIRTPGSFADGETSLGITVDLPLEMRNRVSRLEVEGERSASATVLLDNAWQRQRVGIVIENPDRDTRPLLGEAYFLDRALTPSSEISTGSLATLMDHDPPVIILTDHGLLSPEINRRVEAWINRGGVLLRFAGAKMAAIGANPETARQLLSPVTLQGGGRSLNGVMSWARPAALAPFDESSPFYGLALPDDVRITRHILSRPGIDPGGETWARLTDGTPLVSATRRGDGWLVLMHTAADADWSNLPISGLFVHMLRRLVTLSHGADSSTLNIALPAIEILDGFGVAQKPGPGIVPLPPNAAVLSVPVNAAHPPGYYGRGHVRRALNLSPTLDELIPLGPLGSGIERTILAEGEERDLMAWCLALALILLLFDTLVTLWLRGHLSFFSHRGLSFAAKAGVMAILLTTTSAVAGAEPPASQNTDAMDEFILAASLKTRLAYVLTGDEKIDGISRAGLSGLSRVVTARTAAELGDPMGLDLDIDEIVFFPLLYWPIGPDQRELSASTTAKLNDYLGSGGTVLFDIQDRPDDLGESAAGKRLRLIARELDIPPLAPVPADHVLTRSFYLAHNFPGRWDGNRLWIADYGGLNNDNVSPVLIGGNDWAGAWALDEEGIPLYPTVPDGEFQREAAFRFGVNLVMYVLTGNYKSDQVHVPAILERLGQ